MIQPPSTPPDKQTVSLPTNIPIHEKPVYIVTVIHCESGQTYLGNVPGTNHVALQVLIGAVRILAQSLIAKMLEHEQDKIMVAPAGAIPPIPPGGLRSV